MDSPPASRSGHAPTTGGARIARRHLFAIAALLATGAPGLARGAGPQGQLTWGVHISLAPTAYTAPYEDITLKNS